MSEDHTLAHMDYGGVAALSGIAIIIYLVITIGAAALGLWLTYTIIWRAVRRGLREFYHPPTNVTYGSPRTKSGPRDW